MNASYSSIPAVASNTSRVFQPEFAKRGSMTTKILILILAAATINFDCATSAFAQTEKDQQRFSEVKHEVEKLGFDEQEEVRLKNGSNLKGGIRGIEEDHFMYNRRQGSSTEVPYCRGRGV